MATHIEYEAENLHPLPRKHVLLLTCMDVRLIDNTVTYMNSLNLTNRYDAAAQLWIQRSDQIHAAMMQFRRNKTLPTMEELGIPRPAPVP